MQLKRVWFWPLIVLVSVVLLSASYHKFYSSLTVMEYNPVSKSIETTITVFADDWETAIQQGKLSANPMNDKQLSTLSARYVSSHFSVKAFNGKSIPVTFIGVESGVESHKVFLEIDLKNPNEKFTVENTLLTDYFDDQKNLIYWRKSANGKTENVLLTKENKSHRFN